jgi:hypothetical protein
MKRLTVGSVATKVIKSRYLETWSSRPGKVVFADDNDRQKSSYDYFVFDRTTFLSMAGGVDVGGKATFTVDKVDEQREGGNPRGAVPMGGFTKTFFECTLTKYEPALDEDL